MAHTITTTMTVTNPTKATITTHNKKGKTLTTHTMPITDAPLYLNYLTEHLNKKINININYHY